MTLGAPPRVITPALAAYVARTLPARWPPLIGLAIVLGFVVATPVSSAITTAALVGEGTLLAAAAALYVTTSRRRARVRRLLEHAPIQHARVVAVVDLHPDSMTLAWRVELDVAGAPVAIRGHDPRLGKLVVDATTPVLADGALFIATVLLAAP